MRNSLVNHVSGCLFGLLAAGCSADETVAPPVATSIQISPVQVDLAVGQTSALSVRVLDQRGSEMAGAGATAVWSSSDTTRITIDATGLARGVRPGTSLLTASLGSLQGTAQARVLTPALNPDAGRAVSRRMGTGGGIVNVENGAGVRFELEVLPGSLLDSTTIVVTPVGTVANSPFDNLLGAVRLEPDGVQFIEPAKLRITMPAAPANPKRIIGLHFANDGSAYTYVPVVVNGREITIDVPHFSGAGAFNPASTPPPPVSSPQATYAAQIGIELYEAAAEGRSPDLAFIVLVFEEWYDLVVKPALIAIANSGPTLMMPEVYTALQFWRQWLYTIDGTGLGLPLMAALASKITEADNLALSSVQTLIDRLNSRCIVDRDRFIAASIFAVQHWAGNWGIDRPGAGIDEATVLRNICMGIDLKVVLPPSLPSGQPFDLKIEASIMFGGQVRDETIPLDILLDPDGTTNTQVQNVQWQGPTTTVQLTPTGDRSVDVWVDACARDRINPPSMLDVTDICRDESVTSAVDPWYAEDFEQGNPGTEWSHIRVRTSPSGQRYLGDFTNQAVDLYLAHLPAHTQVRIEFDFHTISDWEGSASPSQGGTDIVVFALDGGVLLQTTFSTKPGFAQAWPGPHPGARTYPAMDGTSALNRLGYPGGSGHTGDATYRISFTAQHTDTNLTFAIKSFLDTTDPTTGERWGLDNVRVLLIN